ncbi:DUF6520 family protein [Puia dinghuensis]|uniref:DUF6520 family protein n=1 Tax=Puia dinghuensis TaxID=1792502 RepID=UPI00166C30E9|nr:DUF6520 family protein [Puia dinghuensis]
MKKLKLILTSSAVIIAVAGAFALRENKPGRPDHPTPSASSAHPRHINCKKTAL